jgi:hypothetical protein
MDEQEQQDDAVAYVRGLGLKRFREEFENKRPVLFTPDSPVTCSNSTWSSLIQLCHR